MFIKKEFTSIMYFILFILSGLSIANKTLAPVTFIWSLMVFINIYRKNKTKVDNWPSLFLLLMVYALPFSWISFLGTPYGGLPVSWFNIFGAMFLLSFLFLRNISIPKKHITLFVISLITILLSIVPYFYSANDFKNEALTQLIVITFHNFLILFSIFMYNKISSNKVSTFYSIYIKGVYYSSIMLFIQYFSINIIPFNFGITNYYLNRESLLYLFGDASHGSLYLATGAFLIFMNLFNPNDRNKKNFVQLFIVFSGVALTSARTGLFVLIGFVSLFVIFSLKSFSKKIIGIVASIFLFFISNKALQLVRPIHSTNLLDSSGRTEGYITALNMLNEKPLTGFGYSQTYISIIMNQPIPHLSILQYSIHAGYIIAFCLFFVQFLIFIDACKKKNKSSWLIAMVLIGTCLIPDLFATRFITVLCMLSLMESPYNSEKATLTDL